MIAADVVADAMSAVDAVASSETDVEESVKAVINAVKAANNAMDASVRSNARAVHVINGARIVIQPRSRGPNNPLNRNRKAARSVQNAESAVRGRIAVTAALNRLPIAPGIRR